MPIGTLNVKGGDPISSQSRSARHSADAAELMSDWGDKQLAGIEVGDPLPIIINEKSTRMSLRVRHWLELNGAGVPSESHLQKIIVEVAAAKEDATPLLRWVSRRGVEIKVRRFQGYLHLDGSNHKTYSDSRPFVIDWDISSPLTLPDSRVLEAVDISTTGLDREKLKDKKITVRSRVGGERCHPPFSEYRRTLKNILREERVPPWERNTIPLLFVDDELAVVVGYFVCKPFLTDKNGVSIKVSVGVDE